MDVFYGLLSEIRIYKRRKMKWPTDVDRCFFYFKISQLNKLQFKLKF